jgi:hypothetical protein
MKPSSHITEIGIIVEDESSVIIKERTDNGMNMTKEILFKNYFVIAAWAFFVTWGAVWFYVATFPMAYEGRDFPIALAKQKLINQCRADQVAIFGDSRVVAGVWPNNMSVPVENLAYPGASPVETYFFIKRLLRCPKPPRLVVIAHSVSMYPKDEYFWSLFAALHVLRPAEIGAVVSDAHALGDDELVHAEHPNGIPLSLLGQLYEIWFPPLYFGPLLTGYVAARERYNERAYQEAIVSSGRSPFGTADGSDAISDEAKMRDWQVSPLVDLYLNRTMTLLSAHNVPVVIMTMPINASTCKQLPSVIQARFSAYLQQIKVKYANIKLVDANVACWPDRFYGDAWHFNTTGALAYSQELQSLLRSFQPLDEMPMRGEDQRKMLIKLGASVADRAGSHDD